MDNNRKRKEGHEMDQMLYEVLKLLIMVAVVFAAYLLKREIIPFVQSKMTAEQLATARELAEMFVYMAQQVFNDKTGAERKKIVTEALKAALIRTNISLTDQIIDDMIEAAVKGLRIAESSGGITVNTKITADKERGA